jgi:hypothetical protein
MNFLVKASTCEHHVTDLTYFAFRASKLPELPGEGSHMQHHVTDPAYFVSHTWKQNTFGRGPRMRSQHARDPTYFAFHAGNTRTSEPSPAHVCGIRQTRCTCTSGPETYGLPDHGPHIEPHMTDPLHFNILPSARASGAGTDRQVGDDGSSSTL